MSHRKRPSLVLPLARTGLISLKSGEWEWGLDVQGERFRLHFELRKDHNQQMVAYCRRAQIGPEVVMAHARDPFQRFWKEDSGQRWTLRFEKPSLIWIGRRSTPPGSDPIWLVFDSGTLVRFAWVAERANLGELTDAELMRLLDDSEVRTTEWERAMTNRSLIA